MSSDEEEAPQYLVNKINRVFNVVTRPRQRPPVNDEVIAPATIRRRRGEAALASSGPLTAGGFIPFSPPLGGGFIVEDEDEDQPQQSAVLNPASNATHIPLAMIPSALQMLDLPPADDEVLEVFRNAAGGWDGSTDGQQGVSRKDWKSVCLILLSQQEQPRPSSGDEIMEDAAQQEDSGTDDSEDDEYHNKEEKDWVEDEPSDDDDGDEYTQTPKRAADRKRKGKGKPERPSRHSRGKKRRRDSFEDDEEPQKSMTQRQRAACREAFALFFPDMENKDLDSQRIMIKDIVRVAGLVKEKLSAEDVVEMLNEFSTERDKSVSLSDFEHMMTVAKLA